MVQEDTFPGAGQTNNKQENLSLPTEWRVEDFLEGRSYEDLMRETQDYTEKGKEVFESLSPSMDRTAFMDSLDIYSELWRRIYALQYYPHARALVNIIPEGEETNEVLHQNMAEIQKEAHGIYRHIEAWLQGKSVPGKEELDPGNQERLFQGSGVWQNYLEGATKATGAHALDPEREREVFHLHGDIQTRQRKSRAEIEGADVGAFRENFANKEPSERRQAYEKFLAVYKESAPLLSKDFQEVMEFWTHNTKERGFARPISKRNWENGISNALAENLLSSVQKNTHLFHPFFEAKGRHLGQEKLDRRDLYAPVGSVDTPPVTYEESFSELHEFCKTTHPELADLLQSIASSGHVDVEPRGGKRVVPMTAPALFDTDPFILLNFDGGTKATESFAHELGHAWHMNSARELPYKLQKPSRFVNEIFSNFIQKLYVEHQALRGKHEGPQQELARLHDKILNTFHANVRQTHFTIFQTKVYEKHAQTGEVFGTDDLNREYRATLDEQFGEAVSVDESFDYEWASEQTMANTPFDNYIYSVGDFFSDILVAQYKKDPEDCIRRLREAMAAGGAESPEMILRRLGINIEDPEIWEEGFRNTAEDIQKFIEMTREAGPQG